VVVSRPASIMGMVFTGFLLVALGFHQFTRSFHQGRVYIRRMWKWMIAFTLFYLVFRYLYQFASVQDGLVRARATNRAPSLPSLLGCP
jgi:hypothetical protein